LTQHHKPGRQQMTRDIYDKATVALDKTLMLQRIRDKIKQECPELIHDKRLKEWIGDDLFIMIEAEIASSAKEFGEL
jgi:hypothetical protein